MGKAHFGLIGLGVMGGPMARHLAAAGRVTDMHGIMQIEVFGQRREVVGVVVHVMTVAGLARAAVAAAVEPDAFDAAVAEATKRWAELPRGAYRGQVHMNRSDILGRLADAVAEDRGRLFDVPA